ncbi:tubulin--tyrosine ligase family protein [Marinobacter sp. LV10R520-4]|uniref:tubulin--tyrosine ligase family protein n=1 Tax=Marinobacter sp. LV10R520-4 TaxID=1761796 RepID=UPI001E5C3C32|nr:tubulin--tyrosine ligase family protein [Marinobacter sp. LV10R520-4]
MTRYYWMGGNRSYEQDRFFEQSLDKSQWQKAESAEKWDACWYTGMPDQNDFSEVGPERKINHIPGNNALTVKSRLYRSLMDLRERVERQDKGSGHLTERLAFVPRVFSMPEDYHAFQQAALDNPGKRWILKPKNAARGKGIQLVGDPADVPLESSWMVQEYLENPDTMHGRKYVLRLYVLVSSVSPFRVYLYRQGFAKLASAPYNEENANNPYSYLTNPDVNALNLDAEVPVEFVDFERYREWLREHGHDDKALFAKIEDLVALTCLAALEPMRERSRVVGADPRGCYELMGIDCLVDEKLKPWVLECNLSPSLEVCAGPESGGDIEEGIKGSLVADMVEIVGLNSKPVALETGSVVERLVRESQDEIARSGGFKNLVPGADPAAYLPFMALPRLSDWVNNRFLIQSDASANQPAAPATSPSPESTPFSRVLDCGRFRVRLFTDSAPLIGRIEALLEPMAVAGVAGTELLARLEIVRDTPGFTLILEGRVLCSRLPLSGVASAATHAAEAQEIAIDAGLIAGPTLALSACLKADHSRGALLPSGTDYQISALGLPLQVIVGASAFNVSAAETTLDANYLMVAAGEAEAEGKAKG